MRSLMPALMLSCLILSGCHKIYVDKRVPVLPPAEYLVPCSIDYGDRTIAEILSALSAGVDCERADKAAIRSWADEYNRESATP